MCVFLCLGACTSKKVVNTSELDTFKNNLTKLTDSLQNSLPYSSFMGVVTDISYANDTVTCAVYPNLFIGKVQNGQERKMYGKMLASEMLQLISSSINLDADILKDSHLTFHLQYISSKPNGKDKDVILSNTDLINSYSYSKNKTLMSATDYRQLMLANQKNLPTYINPNLILNRINMRDNHIILDCQLHGISLGGVDKGTINREANAKAKSITRQLAKQMKGMFRDFVTYKFDFIYNIYAANGNKLLDVTIPAKDIVTKEEE